MAEPAEERRAREAAEAVRHYTATTIPVHVQVDVRHTILNLAEAERILRAAGSIALGPCGCRKEQRKCDAPINTCLTLNEDSDRAIEAWEGSRHVSVDEALAALRASHESGLVHLTYRRPGDDTTVFCSCCSCCCWFLGALKRFDYHDAIVEASHVAEHDTDRCLGCGACVDRCQFDAWSPGRNENGPSLDPTKCFGCGVCVSTCPSGAVSLVPRV